MKAHQFTRQINYQSGKLRNFTGVDFTSYPSEVDLRRSPEASNIVGSSNGIIEKRTGYGLFATLPVEAEVKLIYRQEYDFWASLVPSGSLPMGWIKTMVEVVQCGTYFYYRIAEGSWVKLAYTDKAGSPSADGKEFAQGDNKFFVVPMSDSGVYKRLYFFGGGSDFVLKFTQDNVDIASFVMLCYDVYREAYIPTTSIGRSATGGGTPYENISLLTWMRKNSFIGEAGVTAYQLDATGIDAVSTDNRHGSTITNDFNGTVIAQILQVGGTYSTIVEGSGLTVNRTTGVVTFSVAPGVSVVTGMDNIIIKFSKNRGAYSRKVKEILTGIDPIVDESIYFYCSQFSEYYCYGLYGLNGMSNYLFTALNNRDHWINLDTFFAPELSYSLVGSNQARIIGYSNVNKYMMIHKEKAGNEPTMFVRSVGLDSNNEIIFPLSYGVPGVSAYSRDSFASVRDEPLFLSTEGIFGVVTSNVTDTQNVQNRSYFIETRLLKELFKSKSFGEVKTKAVSHDGKYFISVQQNVSERTSILKYAESEFEAGIINTDGTLTASSNYLRSKSFKEINPSVSYKIEVSALLSGTSSTIFFYDASYNFISYNAFGVLRSSYVTTPSNAKYYKVRLAKNAVDAFPLSELMNHTATIKTSFASRVYIADPRRKSYSNNDDSESYQLDWYVWDDIPVSCWLSHDGRLYFGTFDGKIHRFKFPEDTDPFKDVNIPVIATWTSPFMYMNNITAKKTLKNLWCEIASYDKTGVDIYYRVKGQEKLVKEKDIDLGYAVQDFTRITVNNSNSANIIVTNRIERQFMGIQFMFRNENADAFGLVECIFKYQVNSDFKGG